MPDAALTALLGASNLSHLDGLLAEQTLSALEGSLEEGRSPFLNSLKALGLTALKDRQGLANAIGKNKRERAAGGSSTAPAATPAPSATGEKPSGPLLEFDVFGRLRGAHKTPGICAKFERIKGKNENDTRAFVCWHCDQTDYFGVKRGRCTKQADCTRYQGKVIQVNHCSGGSDASILLCVRCGFDASDHENLGAWQTGEPMLVTEDGQRFRSLTVEQGR